MAELMDRFPGIDDLERRAGRRMPRAAWEYLASGTGDEASMHRNIERLRDVMLTPELCKGLLEPNTTTTLFGQEYAAPIGIAPVGLTGLIWPGADAALAAAAKAHRIPHTLSTVASSSPETIAPIVGDYGWYQLYPPREPDMRTDMLDRVADAGYRTLVVTADVPAPSRRERQRKAQIRVPPSIGPRLIWDGATHPIWTAALLRHGMPGFETLEKYIDGSSLKQLAGFVGASLGGTLSWDYLRAVREHWQGNLVVKGILDPGDASECLSIGADAVWVSNHGGRQLEASPAAIDCLKPVLDVVDGAAPVFFDSGVRSGADVARAIALGADFVFCGRAFMFSLGALGEKGPSHAFEILLDGLVNVMHQTGCAELADLRDRLTI
ncbi:MAG: alpha-hydroxy acid oxidase [Actinomycetota bacterium]